MANRRYSCIGLFNPKSPENVGSVMRAAGCYGVNSVFYTGKRYARAQEFATDTKMIHQDIPLIGIDDLQKIIPLGCTPVAVELVEGARPLPEYTHPDRAIYIFDECGEFLVGIGLGGGGSFGRNPLPVRR